MTIPEYDELFPQPPAGAADAEAANIAKAWLAESATIRDEYPITHRRKLEDRKDIDNLSRAHLALVAERDAVLESGKGLLATLELLSTSNRNNSERAEAAEAERDALRVALQFTLRGGDFIGVKKTQAGIDEWHTAVALAAAPAQPQSIGEQQRAGWGSGSSVSEGQPQGGGDAELAAKAICQERCAFMGETACWQVEPTIWPNPNCNEPGCEWLAKAAIESVAIRGAAAEVKRETDAIREALGSTPAAERGGERLLNAAQYWEREHDKLQAFIQEHQDIFIRYIEHVKRGRSGEAEDQ